MAVKAAGASLELEPLHESGVELLMRAELQTGRPDKAVRTFEGFKTRLASELKLAPSEYLVRLAEAIRG
jgi:DNA-binding SARP family transcriptional activator